MLTFQLSRCAFARQPMKAETEQLLGYIERNIARTLTDCTTCGKCFEACPMTQYSESAHRQAAARSSPACQHPRRHRRRPEALEWDAALHAVREVHPGVSRKRESDADDAALAHQLAGRNRRPGDAAGRQARSEFFSPHQCISRCSSRTRKSRSGSANGDDGRQARRFLVRCNAVSHGDIIHSAIELLRAVGIESDPAGGPAYCGHG